jgi:hypothetical protein
MVRTCVLELETRPAAKTQRLRADLSGWQRYVGVSLRVQQRCTREVSLDDRFFTDTNLNDSYFKNNRLYDDEQTIAAKHWANKSPMTTKEHILYKSV